ncbi:type III-A CRISPR-associated RAMP protein Csm3 [Fontivita pretiosa]|uniref:type III-A CRISPR-associated RAMP protein Csm3 n=1 Tax=Fontivita pretiosa TaxID=2989684 RepID=UPI003D17B6F2
MKQLLKHVEVKGVLRAVTGVRIGAGGASIEIGGLDNPILRHPETRVPYIPGSSLKGKLRSLLEVSGYKSGGRQAPQSQGGPCTCNQCVVCWLFGCGDARKTSEPTRLIFRDCPILKTDESRMKELLKEGVFYSEVKAEVVMDRAKGTVAGAGPRNMDRIMAGTGLDFRLTVRVLQGDDEAQMKAAILHAFRLLEKEGLGGSVSRGYGQVRFENLTWDGVDVDRELHTEPARV